MNPTSDLNQNDPVKQQHHNPKKNHQQKQALSYSSYLSFPSSESPSPWWWWRQNRRIHTSRVETNIPTHGNETDAHENCIDNPSSEIYDACLEMNWDLALQLCRTLPSSAVRYQEGDNLETPLYVACQNQPPLQLVQTLLTICPEATSTKSRQGDIPIHIACRYDAHISVLQALLECDPRTATYRTRFGTTPLIALWEPYCRILQMNARRTNETMISLARTNPTLHQRYVQIQHCYVVLMDRSVRIEEKCQLDVFRNDNAFHEKWTITLELLKAVAVYRENYHVSTLRALSFSGYLVHAAVALKSSGGPLWVLFYVATHFPEQYTMVDGTGRLPLHIAIGPENSLGTGMSNTRQTSSHQHWKFAPKEYWSIRLSLHFYPKSALLFDPNEPTGRYPLHTAIYHGHQWHYGVHLIVDAAPIMLHQIDPTTGIFPFQLAATVYKHNNTAEGLDLVYELIRYDPTVLEICRRRWHTTDDNSQTSPYSTSTTYSKTSEAAKCQQKQRAIVLYSSFVVILGISMLMASKFLRFDSCSM